MTSWIQSHLWFRLERWRIGQVALWTLSTHAARWKSQLLIGPDGAEKAANYGRFPTRTRRNATSTSVRECPPTPTCLRIHRALICATPQWGKATYANYGTWSNLDHRGTVTHAITIWFCATEIFEAFQHPGERQDSGFSQRGEMLISAPRTVLTLRPRTDGH